MQVIKTPSKKNTKKTTKEGTTESTSAASTTSPVKKASKGELEKQIAELQGKLATHEKKEADLKKTLDLHSFERMLKALDSQLPRVKQALELPEPRLDQVLG